MSAVRAVPLTAWLCALAGVLNAAAWACFTPPFQGPDEPAHTYYVQYLAETGKVPGTGPGVGYSPEEQIVDGAVHRADTVGNYFGRPIWTRVEADVLRARLAERPSPVGDGAGVGVGAYPPLYYAALAVPYEVVDAGGGGQLPKLTAMRLLSALFAGLTVLCVFLFLRELLPGRTRAQAAGALACGLLPYFAFITGTVNPDALLALCASALFYAIAVAFRRGLDARLGAAIGACMVAAFLTKLAGAGLVLGGFAALALLVVHAPTGARRSAVYGALTAAVVAAAPLLLYLALNVTVWDRPLLPSSGGVAPADPDNMAVSAKNFSGLLSYSWQYALPRMPFMFDWFPGWMPYDLWFRGWVGRFGWGDYGFGDSVVAIAFAVTLLLLTAALWFAWTRRRSLRERWAEPIAYGALVSGTLALLAYVGYDYRLGTGNPFEQARYLFPLMPLWGALVACGIAGLGRSLGAIAAPALLVGMFALDVGAIVLTVGRYYT